MCPSRLRLAEDLPYYAPNVYYAKSVEETGCEFKENTSPHIRPRLPEAARSAAQFSVE